MDYGWRGLGIGCFIRTDRKRNDENSRRFGIAGHSFLMVFAVCRSGRCGRVGLVYSEEDARGVVEVGGISNSGDRHFFDDAGSVESFEFRYHFVDVVDLDGVDRSLLPVL